MAMNTFPMFLNVAGRDVSVVGGGEQATQKTRLLLKSNARIVLHSDDLDEELQEHLEAGRISQETKRITPDSFAGSVMVFVANGCPGADACIHALAKAGDHLVNVVDQPHLCDAFTPSIVDRAPLVVAIGSEGAAPVLARMIKTRVEEFLEPRLGVLVAFVGSMRDAAAFRFQARDRRELWRWVFEGPVRELFAQGHEDEGKRLLADTIQSGVKPGVRMGRLTLLSTQEDIADLMPMKAVKRLQEADLILHKAGFGAGILELARRDADRISLGATSDKVHALGARGLQQALDAVAEGMSVLWVTQHPAETGAPIWDAVTAFQAADLQVELLEAGMDHDLQNPRLPAAKAAE